MYKLIIKVFRRYPACKSFTVSFTNEDTAHEYMRDMGLILHDLMAYGCIDSYGLELEEV